MFSKYFYVHLVDEKECDREKSCESCIKVFPIKNLRCDYDLVAVHKKWYKRSNKSESGKWLSLIITNQLALKFRLGKDDYLLKQNPYFWKWVVFYEELSECQASNKTLSTAERFEMGHIVSV